MNIPRTTVTSSNLKSIGYDPGRMLLHVEFASGAVHEYANVPMQTHAALMASGEGGSIGRHFHEHIRNGGFTQRRLPDEPLASGSAQ